MVISDKLEVGYLGKCSVRLVDVNFHVKTAWKKFKEMLTVQGFHPATSPTRLVVVCTAHVSAMQRSMY